MISTAELIELNQIIEAQHGDPHHILGMHEIVIGGKDCLVVRAFIPQAEKITVIDPKSDSKYPMSKIHQDGFFECVIKDRQKWFRYMFHIE